MRAARINASNFLIELSIAEYLELADKALKRDESIAELIVSYTPCEEGDVASGSNCAGGKELGRRRDELRSRN